MRMRTHLHNHEYLYKVLCLTTFMVSNTMPFPYLRKFSNPFSLLSERGDGRSNPTVLQLYFFLFSYNTALKLLRRMSTSKYDHGGILIQGKTRREIDMQALGDEAWV